MKNFSLTLTQQLELANTKFNIQKLSESQVKAALIEAIRADFLKDNLIKDKIKNGL